MNLTDILVFIENNNRTLEEISNRLERLLETLHGPKVQEASGTKGNGSISKTGPFYQEMSLLADTRNNRIDAIYNRLTQLEEHFIQQRDTADARSR